MSVVKPSLERAFHFEGDLAMGQAAGPNLNIVHVPSGRLHGLDAYEGVTGSGTEPGADWVRTQPTGTMNLDVRVSVKMDDGEYVYISYTGRAVPNAVMGEKVAAGENVLGSDLYFFTNPVMETNSEKYAWVNDTIFIGSMQELRFATPEKLGIIVYEIYKVNQQIL
jgi:hypothetical protein